MFVKSTCSKQVCQLLLSLIVASPFPSITNNIRYVLPSRSDTCLAGYSPFHIQSPKCFLSPTFTFKHPSTPTSPLLKAKLTTHTTSSHLHVKRLAQTLFSRPLFTAGHLPHPTRHYSSNACHASYPFPPA